MTQRFKSGLRAVLLGLAAQLLVLAVDPVFHFFHLRDHHYLGMSVDGYATLAALLILSITIAELFRQHAWRYGLLAGLGMSLPLVFQSLRGLSPNPETWLWSLGWTVFWMYIVILSLLLLTSLWSQAAAFWFERRRLSSILSAVGSIGLVVALWAGGLALVRSHYDHLSALQRSAPTQQIDMPLPNLPLTALDGAPIPVSEFQGHITVIDFWATWCPACVAEFPLLETVKTEYAGNPTVRFLLVNSGSEGDTPEKVSSFLQRKPTSIPVALNPGQSFVDLCEKLNDSAIPLLVVLDRHGHILYRQYGSDANTNHELHAEIDTLLAAH